MKKTEIKSSGHNTDTARTGLRGMSLQASIAAKAPENACVQDAAARVTRRKWDAMLLRRARNFGLFSYPGGPSPNCHGGQPGEAVYDAASVSSAFEGFVPQFAVSRHCRKAAGLPLNGDVPPEARISERDIYRVILNLNESDRAEAIQTALGPEPKAPLDFHFRKSAEVEVVLSILAAPLAQFMEEKTTPAGKASTVFLHLVLRLHLERDRLKRLEENPPAAALSRRQAAKAASACLAALAKGDTACGALHAKSLFEAVLNLCRLQTRRLENQIAGISQAVK